MNSNIILKNLSVHFGDNGQPAAVDEVSTIFHSGQVTGLIGESGSGKSVLGLSILGLLPNNAQKNGEIMFEGSNLLTLRPKTIRTIRGKKIGFIPQNPADSLNKVLKIRLQVREAFQAHERISKNTGNENAKHLLDSFHFEDTDRVINSYPFQLSGGMKQRIITAIGLACHPEWLIADEPTKGLDAVLRRQVYQLLSEVSTKHIKSMIVITHDLVLAEQICSRILVLYQGHIVEDGDVDEVIHAPLHPYTQGLLNAMPSRGMIPLPAPDPEIHSKGCSFANRCPKASEICFNQKPPAQHITESRKVWCFHIADR